MEYKSCHLLEHGICFFNSQLCACCYAPQEMLFEIPYLAFFYNGEIINKKLYEKKINLWRENAKNGKYPDCCKNCYKLETKNHDEENYIDNVYISHFEQCNAKCSYCITDIKPEKRKKSVYKIVPVLESLKNDGILRRGCEFHIGGGEFTIYPECDEIINKYIISGFAKRLAVATNGIKFSRALFNAMNIDKAVIIISLDCGSKDLFLKIKRVNAFDKVLNNIKKYTSTEKSREFVYLKYIVIPGVNDNKTEFEKFINIALKYKVQGIKIDLEGHYCRKNNYKPNAKLKEFLFRTIEYSKSKEIDVETFSFYNQCIKNSD